MDYYGNNDWRDYLAHYGVKGMKWRHHKYKDENGSINSSTYEYNVGRITGRLGTNKYGAGRTGYKTTSRFVSLGKSNQYKVSAHKTSHPTRGTEYGVSTTLGWSNKSSTKKLGRVIVTRNEDGISVSYTKKNNKSSKKKGSSISRAKKRVGKVLKKIGI